MMIRKRLQESKKKRAAIVYIQPVEYEEMGTMTAANLDNVVEE
jgi:hypothetical protein